MLNIDRTNFITIDCSRILKAPKFQKPTEPYVVLIVGLKAEALADALAAIFWDLRRCEIDRIYCNEYKERQLLDNEIAQSLSKPSKMVILHSKFVLKNYVLAVIGAGSRQRIHYMLGKLIILR